MRFCFLCCFFLVFFDTSVSWAAPENNQRGMDPTIPGPYNVATGDYHFAATVDPEVLDSDATEVWAKVFYPVSTSSSLSNNQFPLIIMLHGNHGTCGYGANPRVDNSCSYTKKGTCPLGYTVVPNHEGYNYLAHHLTSWGYWVVSINVNRGINCGDGVEGDSALILARGKMILKHLSLLYQWSTFGGAPTSIGLGHEGLIGQLDFASVGLFGHSRGGEGARAAYTLYNDSESTWPEKIPGLSIKAIFEVGATDFLNSLDANGAVWNQLLPLCDGDVSNWAGRFAFERMLANQNGQTRVQKSVYEVWGANHNYFNTQWQTSDAKGCETGTPIFDPNKTGSKEQQNIAKASVLAFFKSHLGLNSSPAFNHLFDPLYPSPKVVNHITQVDRDFSPTHREAEHFIIEYFDKPGGTNSSGYPNQISKITMEHRTLKNHQRAGYIIWQTADKDTFFKTVFAASGEGIDLSTYKTLDFRVSRPKKILNKTTNSDFSIRLEDNLGNFSTALPLSDFALLNHSDTQKYHLFQTVRIPLLAFKGIDLTKVHGVQFIFDRTKSGVLYFANVQVHQQTGDTLNAHSTFLRGIKNNFITPSSQTEEPIRVVEQLNSVQIIHQVKSNLFPNPAVEIHLASKVPFQVMDHVPVLHIGKQQFTLSHYSDFDELKEIVFTLDEQQFKNLDLSAEVSLEDGKKWEFGTLNKWLK